MNYRKFGQTDLQVSEIGFGAWAIGGDAKVGDTPIGWGPADDNLSAKAIHAALDAGINFFDTADIYSDGASEEILGKALQGKRQRSLISTKATFTMGSGPNDKGSSRYHLIRACEASLKRLGTDYIDVYYLHKEDHETPLAETVRAIADLVRAGKIRYFGVSNYRSWRVAEICRLADDMGIGKLKEFTELMVRQDVPILVSPGSDSIDVHATAAQHEVVGAFILMGFACALVLAFVVPYVWKQEGVRCARPRLRVDYEEKLTTAA